MKYSNYQKALLGHFYRLTTKTSNLCRLFLVGLGLLTFYSFTSKLILIYLAMDILGYFLLSIAFHCRIYCKSIQKSDRFMIGMTWYYSVKILFGLSILIYIVLWG